MESVKGWYCTYCENQMPEQQAVDFPQDPQGRQYCSEECLEANKTTPSGYCEAHSRPYEWVQVRPGCKRRGCPDCISGRRKAETDAKHLPLIRYSQTWGRDRALTDKEKRFKPRKRGD